LVAIKQPTILKGGNVIIKTIVVSVQDNNVKNVCKFLDIIDGVVEYDVAAEERGVAALQTTNISVMPCLQEQCINFPNGCSQCCHLERPSLSEART